MCFPAVLLGAIVLVACSSSADGPDLAVDDAALDRRARDAVLERGMDGEAARRPNILWIIADDQGLDASAQYALGTDLPQTPVIDRLAAEGLVFENAWATPACTTTRGTLITGQHGVRSGVDHVPARLSPDVQTLHQRLGAQAPELATAIVGKWHLGGRVPELDGPAAAGVGFYAGTIAGTLDDYESWTLTQDGVQSPQRTYHTSAMTDLAIAWIAAQESPWFLWLAYVAPHVPFHLPPEHLHGRALSGTEADVRRNARAYYLAAIEAMDHEIGRLLDSLDEDERANTWIVYVGDNGSPVQVVDVFAREHAKNSIYEGGVRVPLVMAGAGVERRGERENALVNTVDFLPTLFELQGLDVPADVDGVSFASLLRARGSGARAFNYTEFIDGGELAWAVRDERYKLLVFEDRRELYDLHADLGEENDLLADQPALAERLFAYGAARRSEEPR